MELGESVPWGKEWSWPPAVGLRLHEVHSEMDPPRSFVKKTWWAMGWCEKDETMLFYQHDAFFIRAVDGRYLRALPTSVNRRLFVSKIPKTRGKSRGTLNGSDGGKRGTRSPGIDHHQGAWRRMEVF